MIQDFALNIKSAFHSLDFKFYNEPTYELISQIESFCLNNISSSSVHTHNHSACKSSSLVYFQSYSRHLVSFHGTVCDETVSIPVMFCKNDKHYHAVLPNSIFVPHLSFSLFYILRVLSMKSFSSFTVEKIAKMFQISISTLYRWMSKYKIYLRIFTSLKNKYHMHFFIHLIYDFHDLINELFDINLHTLFQYDCTLFNQSD